MEIKLSQVMSALPALVLAVGLISSYTTLSSTAAATEEQVEENEADIKQNSTAIAELDKEVTVMSHQLDVVSNSVTETRSDVKTILTLMQSQRAATQ